MSQKISTRLRLLRLARGESLVQVAAKIPGAALPMFYQIETGARAAEHWREPWARALGIEPDRLFDPNGYPLSA
jgi:hypothetical protein